MDWLLKFSSVPASQSLGIRAQNALLQHFLKTSQFEYGQSKGLNYIRVTNKQKAMQLANDEKTAIKKNTLVLMHGYGLGLGFFFENYDALATHFDEVIAVDWLGMGLSSRYSHRGGASGVVGDVLGSSESLILNNAGTAAASGSVSGKVPLSTPYIGQTQEQGEVKAVLSKASPLATLLGYDACNLEVARAATNQFIDKLEEFRQEQKIEEFHLLGHSLGGFLSAKYAQKYPTHVKSLILASPVGIPLKTPSEDVMPSSQLDWRLRAAHTLWNFNFTPQSLVRGAGGHGQDIIRNILNRRFAMSSAGGEANSSVPRWNDTDLPKIADYFYQISAAPASGEFALNTLLEPVFVKPATPSSATAAAGSRPGFGVYAREPLEREMRRGLSARIPVLVLFGDHDWMYHPSIEGMVAKWAEVEDQTNNNSNNNNNNNKGISSGSRGASQDIKRRRVASECVIVPAAGHHLYLDNAPFFNRIVINWTQRMQVLVLEGEKK